MVARWATLVTTTRSVRSPCVLHGPPIPENNRWWGPGLARMDERARAQKHARPPPPTSRPTSGLRPAARRARDTGGLRRGHPRLLPYYYWFAGHGVLEQPRPCSPRAHPRCPSRSVGERTGARWEQAGIRVIAQRVIRQTTNHAFPSRETCCRPCAMPTTSMCMAEPAANHVPALAAARRPRETADAGANWPRQAGAPGPVSLRGAELLLPPGQPRTGRFGFDAAVEFAPHGLAVPSAQRPASGKQESRHLVYVRTAEPRVRHPTMRISGACHAALGATRPAATRSDTVSTARRTASKRGCARPSAECISATGPAGVHQCVEQSGAKASLEPDQLVGFAYLDATRHALDA